MEKELENLAKLALELGADETGLEDRLKKIQKLISNNEGAGGEVAIVKAAAPVKNQQGPTLSFALLSYKKVDKTGKMNSDKHEYEIMIIDDFQNTNIDSNDGRKCGTNELELNIHCARRLSDAEIKVNKEKAEKENTGRAKAWDRYIEGTCSLYTLSVIKITQWGSTFTKSNGLSFKVGDFGYARNIIPEQQFDTTGKQMYGLSWKCNGFIENEAMNDSMFAELLDSLIPKTRLINVGPTGEYSERNQDVAALEFREQALKENKHDALTSWKLIMNCLSEKAKEIIKKYVVIPLRGMKITSELFVHEDLVLLQKPSWENIGIEVVTRDGVDKKYKSASCLIKANQQLKGQSNPEKVALIIQFTDFLLGNLGMIDPDHYQEIAPFLLSHCDGIVVAKPDLLGSHYLDYNVEITNPKTDGRRRMGVDFGMQYKAQMFKIDLISGIIEAGFHITPECASAALIEVFGSDDLTTGAFPTVTDNAEMNPLNKNPRKHVLNLMEAEQAIANLEAKYQFFLLCNVSVSDPDIQKFIAAAKQDHGEGWMEHMSQVIMGKIEVSFWPVRIKSARLVFTVFAVSNEKVQEALVEREKDTSWSVKIDAMKIADKFSKKRETPEEPKEDETAKRLKPEIPVAEISD